VKVHAAALNPIDYKRCELQGPMFKFPYVLGSDGAGIVEQVGDKVKHFKKGDRVYFTSSAFGGSFGEYCTVREDFTIHLPNEVSFVDGAALPVAGWTAYQMLEDHLFAKKGLTILITAGAGGVGGFAIQLANMMGLKVITTCSAKNSEAVKALGAHHVIDYNQGSVVEQVKALTGGRGADLIFDCVGPESIQAVYPALATGGRIGSITGPTNLDHGAMFWKSQTITYLFVGAAATDSHLVNRLNQIGHEIVKLVASKKLNTTVTSVISMDKIPSALGDIAAHHTRGKVVANFAEQK